MIRVQPRPDNSERGYLLVRDLRRRSAKAYFKPEPTDVNRDVYINRRLACGDLVEVKPLPPKPKKKKEG